MSRYLRKKASQCKVEFAGRGNKRIYFKILSPSGKTHDASIQFECSPCQYTAYEGARDLKLCGHLLAVCDAISKVNGDLESIKGIREEGMIDVDMEGTKETECDYCGDKKHCHKVKGIFGESMCCRECLKEEFNMEVQDGSETGKSEDESNESTDTGDNRSGMAEEDKAALWMPTDREYDRQEDS